MKRRRAEARTRSFMRCPGVFPALNIGAAVVCYPAGSRSDKSSAVQATCRANSQIRRLVLLELRAAAPGRVLVTQNAVCIREREFSRAWGWQSADPTVTVANRYVEGDGRW